MLEVHVLGSFQISNGKKTVEISSRPAQSLFAYLILHAGTAYRREKLAGQLWPDSTDESARDYLRHALWRIRKALGEASGARYIRADDLTISFDASQEYWLDAGALEQVGENAATAELAKALSGYKGELLPGFYDEWVVLEREHLQAVYERQVERLLDELQAQQQWRDVQEWSERWIALGQRPEAAYRHLISAYAAQGDMAKAAAVYDRCVKALAEFEVEPSVQTRRLYEDIRAGRQVVESPEKHERRASPPTPISTVPAPLTSFVGREKELGDIARFLKTQQLLTLVGPGGVGKTRLAIASARRLMAKFPDGVCWVDLVGLSDPDLVPQTVAQSAGLRELTTEPILQTVIGHFAFRQSLLVLDNCEHLISACARLVVELLSASPRLRLLATSREVLGVPGETTFVVPSLSLPGNEEQDAAKSLRRFEGTSLFLERVSAAQSGFELNVQNASAVVQICRRLSGIPLAIELAAARASMMSVKEIAGRLDKSFELLTAGERTALPRHQTLRATIDWSYDLLSELERVLFRRLSVFADGFTLEAVEAVTPDAILPKPQVITLLGHLVSKSLVSALTGSGETETRYRMLETIRQYALEKLDAAGESNVFRERHLEFFADFALRAERGIYSPEQASWYERLDKEADNLRAALDWSGWPGDGSADASALVLKKRFAIISGPVAYWERGYRREIAQIAMKLLEMDQVNAPSVERAGALYAAGFLRWSLYDFSVARAYLEESADIAERLGDRLSLAWSLGYLGWTLESLGELDRAKAVLEQSLAIARSLGDAGSQAAVISLSFLGEVPYRRGDLEEARRLYEEAILFIRELGNINVLAVPVRRLGYVSVRQGRFDESARLFAESLYYNRQLGHIPGVAGCIAGFAAICVARGSYETAALLCGCVEILLERFGAPFFSADRVEFERSKSLLTAGLEARELAKAWARGRTMQLDQAINSALESVREPGLRASDRKPRKRNTANTR